MNITLKNDDTLNITLPNGNKVVIDSHSDISNIAIANTDTLKGCIDYVKITNFGKFNSVKTWFEGGIKKISKNAQKNWFNIGEDITLFKN